jgi:hypothetical protein
MEQMNCTAFEGMRCVASGTTVEVAKKIKECLNEIEQGAVLIFDDSTGEPVEIDFRGGIKDVLLRLKQQEPVSQPDTGGECLRGPGRPKLGVVSREVSLLPRHWDWLNVQPGGASAAIRKLVEEARRVNRDRDRVRRSQEAAYRFMSAMAGNLPGFEEAIRALFAGDAEKFNSHITEWPADIRNYTGKISSGAFMENK